MTPTSTFILYLIVFRLSMIAAGLISIILGYRLFCKGIFPESGSAGSTTVDAKIGENQFKMANAAPGTLFALFGVVIISLIFVSGGPEITLKQINGSLQDSDAPPLEDGGRQTYLSLRGDNECPLIASVKKGRDYEERRDVDKAIQSYQTAVGLVAQPMNYLAWLYHTKGEDDKALSLATMAVSLMPDDANSLDTLAEIELSEGHKDNALTLMEKAAKIDPRLTGKLQRFKEMNQDH